jgi:hypothetical protein
LNRLINIKKPSGVQPYVSNDERQQYRRKNDQTTIDFKWGDSSQLILPWLEHFKKHWIPLNQGVILNSQARLTVPYLTIIFSSDSTLFSVRRSGVMVTFKDTDETLVRMTEYRQKSRDDQQPDR